MAHVQGRSNSVRAGFGRAATMLVATMAILAACAAPGAGSSNPPAAAAAAGTSAPGAAGLVLDVRQEATLGAYVAGKEGHSLYVFEKDADANGGSACYSDCAGNWPALVVASAADVTAGSGVTGALGTITRTDGKLQVTLGGKLLYYYSGDSGAGDTNGQGFGDVWYLASPSGDPVGEADQSSGPGAKPTPTDCGRYCKY
jgi:predicted lipoprotein with Yx(FWY)xxD motif